MRPRCSFRFVGPSRSGWSWSRRWHVARREGSCPEVIEDGATGFVRHFEDDLVRAVERIPELDRRRCRDEAERRFSPAAMADAYESVYAGLLERSWASEVAVYA